ncbi:MAG: hypothetical protein LBH11_03395 [Propionibacteriaceae bacterium]|nr:hypothetical protein [Propionibacteriaceae bacterium]
MSYLITTVDDGTVLMDTALPTGPRIANPTLVEQLNNAESFTFTIAADHPAYRSLLLRHWVQIYDRATDETTLVRLLDPVIKGTTVAYTCEGVLACLNDTLATREDWQFAGTPAELIDWILAPHNAQAVLADGSPDPQRQIVRGVVSDNLDPNNYVVRSIDASPTISSAEMLARSTHKSSAGGFIRVRTVNGVNYLDWLSAPLDSGRTIRYAVTLQEWQQQLKAADIFTACWPEGAQLDSDDPDFNGRLHLDGATAGAVELWPGSNRWGYANLDAEARYGRVVGTATWDDIHSVEVLLQRSAGWVAAHMLTGITINAAAADIEHLHPGDAATFLIPDPVGINTKLNVSGRTRILTDRTRWTIAMGAQAESLVESVATARRAADQVSELQNSTVRLGEQVAENRHSTLELSSLLDQTAETIRAEVASTYATQDTLNSEAEARETAIAIAADGVLGQFNEWRSTTYTDEMGAMQTRWDAADLWWRVGVDGMQIGRLDSSFRTHIGDDDFTITQNGIEQFKAKGNRVGVGALRAREYVQVGAWRWLTIGMPAGEVFGLVWTQLTEED